jgi:hypothetical protein
MVAVLVMLERLEKRPGTAPAVFLPPISVGSASVSWFRVSPLPPPENVSGSLYIGVFRSTRQFEIKTNDIGASRAK